MQDLWNQVRDILIEHISPVHLDGWFTDVRIAQVSQGEVLVEVPSRFHLDWITDNFHEVVRRAFSTALGRTVALQIRVQDDRSAAAELSGGALEADEPQLSPEDELLFQGQEEPALTPHQPGWRGQPNPEKTFDNFVVGTCNEFAHGAALAVSDFPGGQYNPLFIYGGTGLGKTHLVHAIGNRIRAANPSALVTYITAEQVMNEMISALRFKRMPEFRERFRSRSDVLLVDDIQFLGGKASTQQEFFHTFEALMNSGRQIVMTADMLPRDIEGLEERLRTRFSGGLEADLQPPDLETMLAILQKKAEELHLVIPQDVALFIAGGVRYNIRELEGALKRLTAVTAMYHEPVTLETARRRLSHLVVPENPVITPDQIIKTVARIHNVKTSDITGPSHQKRLVRPRHIAIYLIREHTDLSFPDIGRVIGGRDSATVQYAYRRITELRQKDPDMQAILELLEKNLHG
jgi:chromosomal replication initiator protein